MLPLLLRYPLVFRFFGLKSLRTSLGDWRRRGDLFSPARAILHIMHAMEMQTILDLFFTMRFAEQPSSLETLAKWIVCITILRLSYYHELLRFFKHLE